MAFEIRRPETEGGEEPDSFTKPAEVVYEDEEIAVALKPAGLLTHPTGEKNEDSLISRLLSQRKLSKGTAPERPGVVHRLDKDVSGLLVFAKTAFAERSLMAQFKSRKPCRVYQAITVQPPAFRNEEKGAVLWDADPYIQKGPADSKISGKNLSDGSSHFAENLSFSLFHAGRMHADPSLYVSLEEIPNSRWAKTETYMGRHPKRRTRFISSLKPFAGSKKAITFYRILKTHSHKGFSFIELRLKTGRSHQIRVQLAALGAPILGDKIYGSVKGFFSQKNPKITALCNNLKRIALHAGVLGFSHPVTKKNLLFKAPWPEDLTPLSKILNFHPSDAKCGRENT